MASSVFLNGFTRITIVPPPEVSSPRLMEMVLGDAELKLPGGIDPMLTTFPDHRVRLNGSFVPVELCPFDADIAHDPAKLLARAVLRDNDDAVWPLIDRILMTREVGTVRNCEFCGKILPMGHLAVYCDNDCARNDA